MYQILLVINLIVVIIMIGLILLQRSEGGALGMGGGGGGMMSSRGAGNALTKATAVLAAIFMLSALALTWITRQQLEPTSILDSAPTTEQGGDAAPDEPVIPLSE